jgi:hypothetical protein
VGGENWNVQRKTCSSATLSTIILTSRHLELNLRLHGEKSAFNNLIYGMGLLTHCHNTLLCIYRSNTHYTVLYIQIYSINLCNYKVSIDHHQISLSNDTFISLCISTVASHIMGTRSFLEVNWLGHGINHPLPSSAKVKERAEVYLYYPSVPSWQVTRWLLPFLSKRMTLAFLSLWMLISSDEYKMATVEL